MLPNSKEILEVRAKRLVECIEMDSPPQIIGQEVTLVLEAAKDYCPRESLPETIPKADEKD